MPRLLRRALAAALLVSGVAALLRVRHSRLAASRARLDQPPGAVPDGATGARSSP